MAGSSIDDASHGQHECANKSQADERFAARIGLDRRGEAIPLSGNDEQHRGDDRKSSAERHQQQAHDQAADDHKVFAQKAISPSSAIARSARRSRADSFSVALLSWPQAARMSRPRGVRTGEA